jgi:hypothetical protein
MQVKITKKQYRRLMHNLEKMDIPKGNININLKTILALAKDVRQL